MARKQIDMRRLNDRVVTSGKEFNAVAEQIIREYGREAEDLGRGVMLDLYGELVSKAPKDTGRAAAGFNIHEDPSEWTPPEGEYKSDLGSAARENAQNLGTIPSGRTITISNNVEYLLPLENGHSRQAPSGFLAAAIHWARRRLEVAAEKFGRARP